MQCLDKKARRREENKGFRSDLQYWSQMAGRDLQLNIKNLHQFVGAFEDHCDENTKRIELKGFRTMLGFLGQSFIGERMFTVICRKPSEKSFDMNDYLVYQDIVYHGTDAEKNMISFKMLDISNTGRVSYGTYETFFSQFLKMYSELFNYKITIDDQALASARSAFDVISQGHADFDFAMFEKARKDHPQLLEWIDQPEQILQQECDHPDYIKFSQFTAYHKSVMGHIKNLENQLEVSMKVDRPDALLAKFISNSIVKQLSMNPAASNKVAAANETSEVFQKIDKMEAEIMKEYQSIVSPAIAVEPKKQEKQQSRDAIGGGGGFVSLQSQSYDVILNVLVGIRRSLGDLSNSLPTKLDDHQYVKKLTLETDWMTSKAQRHSTYKFTEYAPLPFQKLRSLNGIDEDEYLKSLGPEQVINSLWSNNQETLYELSSSGKSGALFYYTKDRKYMLKSIAGREFAQLRKFLKDYLNHLAHNPDSVMTKFYGMYKLEWKNPDDNGCMGTKVTKSHIIVMDNLYKNFDVGIRFDLKGSFKSRTRLTEGQTMYEGRDATVAMKDNDFRTHMKQLTFVECLKPDMPLLNSVLEKDTAFLSRNNLIDYSFLVGQLKPSIEEIREKCKEDPRVGRGIYIDTENKAWLVGIIDPLNVFDHVKKAEYWIKRPKFGMTMSCVPPQQYEPRFLKFMADILVQDSSSKRSAIERSVVGGQKSDQQLLTNQMA